MGEYVCSDCGYVGRQKKVKQGSTLVEVLLWVVLIVPGPFYTAWRMMSKKSVCPHCENDMMVSVTSPVGKRLVEIQEVDFEEEGIREGIRNKEKGVSGEEVEEEVERIREKEEERKREGERGEGIRNKEEGLREGEVKEEGISEEKGIRNKEKGVRGEEEEGKEMLEEMPAQDRRKPQPQDPEDW